MDVSMYSGEAIYHQFNSLQAFWPSLQVLLGDVELAERTFDCFYQVWLNFQVFPERYWFAHQVVHGSERYYPLRPELAESGWYLYQATHDAYYLHAGREIYNSIQAISWVPHGYAGVANVETFELEDRMNSFFLAEVCKYLYLLFDEQNFLNKDNYLLSTEAHYFHIGSTRNYSLKYQQKLYELELKKQSNTSDDIQTNSASTTNHNINAQAILSEIRKHNSLFLHQQQIHLSEQVCPIVQGGLGAVGTKLLGSACHVEDKYESHRCFKSDCGVDSGSCKIRECSSAGYCFTPP